MDDLDFSLSSQSDARLWPSPPSCVKFSTIQQLTPIPIALAGMLITLSNIPLSLHAAAPGTPMDWNEPEKKSAGTRETRRASQISRARREIVTWEALAAQFVEAKRPERDGYIIFSHLDSLYRVLGSNDALTDEDRARQSKVRDVVGELKKKNPDWELMQDRRLSDEISVPSAPSKPSSSKFAPQDRRPLEFLNDAKYLAVQFQYRIEFYDLTRSSLVDNQGGAISLRDPQGGAMDWRQLHQRSRMTFKRRFRVKTRQGASHAIVCTDALHSWYQADSGDEESALAHDPQQSNNSIPWVNPSGQHGDFCGVVDYSGRVLFRFSVAQHPGGDLLLPLAVREDGSAAVLVGESVKRETGDGPVAAVGRFREVLVWSPMKALRRISVDPNTSNEVLLRGQFRENKL
jgi:hypothetical protein